MCSVAFRPHGKEGRGIYGPMQRDTNMASPAEQLRDLSRPSSPGDARMPGIPMSSFPQTRHHCECFPKITWVHRHAAVDQCRIPHVSPASGSTGTAGRGSLRLTLMSDTLRCRTFASITNMKTFGLELARMREISRRNTDCRKCGHIGCGGCVRRSLPGPSSFHCAALYGQGIADQCNSL